MLNYLASFEKFAAQKNPFEEQVEKANVGMVYDTESGKRDVIFSKLLIIGSMISK
jgi:hypothetical protein